MSIKYNLFSRLMNRANELASQTGMPSIVTREYHRIHLRSVEPGEPEE